jgi:cobalamin biosynthetic protein CobC
MEHGGRLQAAQTAYGAAPGPWLDLSTGINPHAWPGADAIAVDWRALPDEQALCVLEEEAAAYFGVAARHVCALPGSEIGLRLVGGLSQSCIPVHVAPSYRTHGDALPGSAPVTFEALPEVAGQGRMILLANPNNPDGRVLMPDSLGGIVERCAASGGWLIVDEAFADADPALSVAPEVGDDVPLLVFRSFGKFFGLAGVRLGFAIGPEKMVGAMRHRLGSWPVSTAALAIGTAAYLDADWIAEMRRALPVAANALDEVLLRHGFTPRGDCPLFRLIETEDAIAIFDRLAAQGILTRPFDYDRTWLRIGLPGSAEALERLAAALAHD